MAEQSFLAKAGLRLGILGSTASLAIAAPLATNNYDPSCHSDAARIGWYFDRTAGAEKMGTIVGGINGPLYTRSGSNVNVSMLTPQGLLTVGDGTGSPNYILQGAAGQNRFVFWQTAGLNRWAMGANNTAEGGSDSGSDLVINAYSDAGALLGSVITLTRAALGTFTLSGRSFAHAAGTLTTATQVYNGSVTWNNAGVTFTAWSINVTDTLSGVASTLLNLQISSTSRLSVVKNGQVLQAAVDDLSVNVWTMGRIATIAGNVTDGYQTSLTPTVNGAFTVTRYNYISMNNPAGTSTITDGCALRFNANAGSHKAVDAGTTKTSPGTVDAWMKINVNGAIRFQPLYTSKTT